MHRIYKLSQAQRVVVVVAIGVGLLTLGSYLTNLGQPDFIFGGISGYAPLSGWPNWLRLIVWLALTSLWAVISIRLLRPTTHEVRPEGGEIRSTSAGNETGT